MLEFWIAYDAFATFVSDLYVALLIIGAFVALGLLALQAAAEWLYLQAKGLLTGRTDEDPLDV